MSDFGIIFCGECNSIKVDSGFDTESTLRCTDCGNEKAFRVGKVTIPPDSSAGLEEILTQAKKEAYIYNHVRK